jgi:uncharacterized membrane protein
VDEQAPSGGESRLRLALALVAAAGLGVAGYLTFVHYQGSAPVCLAGGHGCERVQSSDYAELVGFPVAAWGLGFYAAVLASASLRGDAGRAGGFALGLVGFGFSLYLTYLELFVIEAICQWCVASAALATLILVVASWRFLRYWEG